MTDVTRLIEAAAGGDAAANEALLALVYDELRRRALGLLRAERPGHTLQPTALVHEAWMRLAGQEAVCTGRQHFFALAARMMRRVLVDHARSRLRHKRGGDQVRVELDVGLSVGRDADVLALEEALERLAEIDPQQAELVELRFYGGLTVAEVAEIKGVSRRTVEAEWTMIKAWLRREMGS